MKGLRIRVVVSVVTLSILGLAVGGSVYREELVRLYRVVTLFDESRIVSNFHSMGHVFNTRPVRAGQIRHHFRRAALALPLDYEYQGHSKSVARFLEETWTTGLVVLLDGTLVFEQYFRGNTASSECISWSLAKSFVSALVGIAVQEGHIADITEPVSDYVPRLRGTGYDGVAIKDILQMSSGIRFTEDYGDSWSDINRLGRALALGSSMDGFVASLQREREPGTYNHYVSTDTQVLGMLLRQATGETLSSYLESRIWKKIGMEADAYWLVDGLGMELAFGGLNAVLRDYARFGQLYLNGGRWKGEQIVPEAWVSASVTPDAPHLQPGENPASSWVLGYGYQWWVPQQADGEFLAIGIYNQFIYVYPRLGVVIAKTSAYPAYNVDGRERELETIAVFRAIAKHFALGGLQHRR
jgi:CubicO group peptidase (beta-lactamase class C family)